MSEQFIKAIAVVQKRAHQINVTNGFWRDLNKVIAMGENFEVIALLSRHALMDSEVAEATEAARKQPKAMHSVSNVKDTMVREYAGAVVRIMDVCERFKLPLGEAILEELAANEKRGFMHGNKRA